MLDLTNCSISYNLLRCLVALFEEEALLSRLLPQLSIIVVKIQLHQQDLNLDLMSSAFRRQSASAPRQKPRHATTVRAEQTKALVDCL